MSPKRLLPLAAIVDQVKGAWRFGNDEETGATGWILDGDLTHGVPCG